MPLILEGRTLATAIREAVTPRADAVRQQLGRPATLAAVAIANGHPETLFFDVKRRAFEAAGAAFRPVLLPAGTTTGELQDCVARLNEDAGVDGIYVQYPLPEGIDAQAVYDGIALAKDVDGASSLQSLEAPSWYPATAEAVVGLLLHHQVPLAASSVAIVQGDPLFAGILAHLFQQAGAVPAILALEDAAGGIADKRDIIVAATGVVDGVPAASFPDGVAAVDVGYYHGGGRGDIAATPADIERMSAWAPPQGSIGPLTVALLISQTVAAAEAVG